MRCGTILVEFIILSVAGFLWVGVRHANIVSLSFGLSPTRFLTDPGSNCMSVTSDDDFDWSTLKPSLNLDWSTCYSTFQCARFTVPLNYSEPTGASAVIAVIRKPATNTDPADYKGPVLFNPGGPGGSGVQMVLTRGEMFSKVLGPQFDIVGFDPRGVGRTTPTVSWFESEIEARLWEQGAGKSAYDTFEDFSLMWARSRTTGRIAEERNLDAVLHLRTENVAQDMLRITEAHGYEKLKYWGFSYGTLLGATFASLFPDKVERLVLDGVADAEDYYASDWANGIRDTDKSLQVFFDQCAASSPEDCPFWSPTAEEISARLDGLYKSLREKPIPITTQSGYGYDILNYSTLKRAVFTSLYVPYQRFYSLADGLKDLEAGNGTKILNMERGGVKKPVCDCGNEDPQLALSLVDTTTAIACGDGKEITDTPEELYERYQWMLEEFGSFADLWVFGAGRCSGWRVRAPERFLGPFRGNTSNPILFIGNTADPVTPLWSARNVASGFPGSIVLTQNSNGHCSIAAPSLCTLQHIQAYFTEGKMPDEGTICEPSEPIFKPRASLPHTMVPLSLEEEELLQVARDLSRDTGITRHL